MEILFVCSGNTCRSAMAEALLRELTAAAGMEDVTASSAGTYASPGEPASIGAVAAMDQMGADLHLHRATRLGKGQIEAADLVLCMGASHQKAVLTLCPEAAGKTRLLLSFACGLEEDVQDPFGGDSAVYEACASQLCLAVAACLMKLRPERAQRIRQLLDTQGME